MARRPTTKTKVKQLVDPLSRAKFSVTALPHGKGSLVADLIFDYLASPRYAEVSDRTKRVYQANLKILELLILADGKCILQYPVTMVTYAIVDYMHRVLRHSFSPASIKVMFSILSNVWEVGIRLGKVTGNPWLRNGVKCNNQRDITWTAGEIKRAIDYARENKFTILAAYIILMYETSQRPWQDLRNLTWDNYVTFDDGTKGLDFVISKTGSRVSFPLSDEAISLIESLPRSCEYILADKNGERLTQGGLTAQFKKVKKYAFIRNELLLRDIRRTVVTEMAQAGATRDQIRAVTGWKSDAVVTRYARSRTSTAACGLDKLWEMRKKNKEREKNGEKVEDNQYDLFGGFGAN